MCIRLLILAALLLYSSPALGASPRKADDGRGVSLVAAMPGGNGAAEQSERNQLLRVGVLLPSQRISLLPRIDLLRHDRDHGVAACARWVMHKSGCPPPKV